MMEKGLILFIFYCWGRHRAIFVVILSFNLPVTLLTWDEMAVWAKWPAFRLWSTVKMFKLYIWTDVENVFATLSVNYSFRLKAFLLVYVVSGTSLCLSPGGLRGGGVGWCGIQTMEFNSMLMQSTLNFSGFDSRIESALINISEVKWY